MALILMIHTFLSNEMSIDFQYFWCCEVQMEVRKVNNN